MGKQSEKGNVTELVIIGVLVLSVIGLIVWRVLDSNTPTASSNTTQSTTSGNSETSQDTTSKATQYVTVGEWGVKFALSDDIKAIGYTYDRSQAVFPGEVISISAITESAGKQYKESSYSSSDATAVDAICSTYGLGRSKNSSETNASSGVDYTVVAHVGDYYYYSLNGVAGARCGQSEGATAAVNAAMDVLKKPLTN